MNQLDDLLWELVALEKECPTCGGKGCDNCYGEGKMPVFEGVREPCPCFRGNSSSNVNCDTCSGKHYVPPLDLAKWLGATQKAFEDILFQCARWDVNKRRHTAFLVEVSTGETFINGDVLPDPLLALLTAIKATTKHD